MTEPDAETRALVDMVEQIVHTVGSGAADISYAPISDLWMVSVKPHRSTAAPISFLLCGDEISGEAGGASFYAWTSDETTMERFREILAMTMLGRIEERGWHAPVLRVFPFAGHPYITGDFSLVPWRWRRRRTWEPYARQDEVGETV